MIIVESLTSRWWFSDFYINCCLFASVLRENEHFWVHHTTDLPSLSNLHISDESWLVIWCKVLFSSSTLDNLKTWDLNEADILVNITSIWEADISTIL